MNSNYTNINLELACVIVNYGLGSKVIKYAKQFGIGGGTILLGKGTIKNPILEFFEINEARKEIVLMASDKNTIYTALENLNKKFNFSKRNHGIAFSSPILSIFGARNLTGSNTNESGGV